MKSGKEIAKELSKNLGIEFRPVAVDGFQDRYLVSANGQFYSLYNNKGKFRLYMRRQSKRGDYFQVLLAMTTGGKKIQICRYVHRLVCEAFHGPMPSGQHLVAHVNGVPTDNRAENLMWATPRENQLHRRLHGTDLHRDVNHQSKLNKRMADAAVYLHTKHRLSFAELGRAFGVTYSAISRIVAASKHTGKKVKVTLTEVK